MKNNLVKAKKSNDENPLQFIYICILTGSLGEPTHSEIREFTTLDFGYSWRDSNDLQKLKKLI